MGFVLQESGDKILQEDGVGRIFQEDGTAGGSVLPTLDEGMLVGGLQALSGGLH